MPTQEEFIKAAFADGRSARSLAFEYSADDVLSALSAELSDEDYWYLVEISDERWR